VKIGEVRTPPAARTRTNGQRRDGVAMCVLRSEEDGAREGEGGGGEVEARSVASHAGTKYKKWRGTGLWSSWLTGGR
jgi:hypothetical protein